MPPKRKAAKSKAAAGKAENKEYHIGMLIMELCNITKKLDINAYSALNKTITDLKSEMIEKQHKKG